MTEITAEIINLLKKTLVSIENRIDQTMLKYDKGMKDYEKFIEESEKFNFRSIVVPPSVVKFASSISRLPVATVVAFPHGYSTVSVKLREIEEAANDGAKEVDVVINNINVKSRRYDLVRDEARKLASTAHDLGLIIKVIIETSVLNDDELIEVSKILADEGVDFIKTNTGFGSRGVVPRDIVLIKQAVNGKAKIKASGGIRTAIDAALLVILGADVLGTSRGIEIAMQAREITRYL